MITLCMILLAPPFIVDMDCAACHGVTADLLMGMGD